MAYTKAQREAKQKELEAKAKVETKIEEQEASIIQTTASLNTDTDLVPVPTETKPEKPIKARKVKKQLPLNTLVEVKNGFNGKLVYASKKTIGYTVVFDNFGDFDYIELGELVAASNASRKFFENNWFLIDDVEVLEFLNVSRFYENAFNTENFDEIFQKTESDISEIVDKLSKGQKNTLIYRAKQKIDTGEIDSRKTIDALEKALNVELIER